ncbi:site-specific integrase [Mesorhizobium sp. M1380]|uniref:tyrosine-type recombinase/integrase n=1 Tax=Mesorhizobium sp. M1380 TaxID=2957093 RepID=UPI0033358390
MAVYPRGDGYQANFMVKGTRYIEQFASEADAERWEFDTRQALKLGRPLPTGPARSVGGGDTGTLGQVLRSAEKEHWGRLNAKTGGDQARLFVKWAGSETAPAEALSEENIRKYINYLHDERRIGTSAINLYKANISVLIKYAKVPKVDLKWDRPEAGQPRFFTEQEVALVIQTLTLWSMPVERDFFMFLVDTGMRPFSEATAFRWDAYWDGKVTLQKAARGRGEAVRRTKTGKSRTVPLTRRAIEAVERQRVRGLKGPFSDITKSRMVYVWDKVRQHLPQLNDTVLYTARHTCASWQVIAGIDLRRVMMWMGHDSYKTTLIYANLAPSHLLDNLAALEGTNAPKLTVVGGKGA